MNEHSWSDFVESEFVGQAVSSKTRYYRDAWIKLLEKKNIGLISVRDPKAITAINSTRSFNWSALLLGPWWAVWRGISYCWFFIAIVWAFALFAPLIPAKVHFGEIGLWVAYGLYGNSWYLTKLASCREDRVESLRPSKLRVLLAIGVTCVCAFVSLLFD